MDDASATALADVPARRPGRRRDDTKDDAILEAARELLAERGFDGMTMDAVAERAGAGKATLYRRWPSKVLLTVDAIVCGPGARMTIDDVPDTGTLRGDLLAVRFGRRRDDDNALMSGLMPVIKGDPQLATVFHEQFVRTRVVLMRALLERARLRGELRADVDLDMVATVPPAMISYRKVIEGGYVDEEFVVRMIDSVILPLVVDTSADTSTPTTADAGAASTA
ncbi:TetR/AcrR family transcriptional regulator [Cellulomonas chitinilytica]|uniref:TetR/AcrR family transcriptional regulator n=1 Tax=Cellulomonas chitinilytica TaxID=398759 RepID=UPI0019444D90|nr:TetR/AcrR family transcriptional regulator [Cellulomonas chitinilytica]